MPNAAPSSSFSQRIKTAWAVLRSGNNWHQMFNRPGAADSNRNGAAMGQPLRQSVWVGRAIMTVAGPISALPLKWMVNGAEVKDAERDAFWQRPAATPGGSLSLNDFTEASIIWLLAKGECFWILDDTYLSRSMRKSRIILAPPDKMRQVVSSGELLGWEYADASGQRHTLLPEQVIQTKFFNPYDVWRGLAPLEAAMIAADADYAAGLFAKHLAQSNGDRGAYVIAKGALDDPQRQQIEHQLREKRRMNQMGVYKTAFISGDVTIEDPKIQAADAAFIQQRLENRHEIAIAFGVPASMFDVVASYSIGSASDRFRLRDDTCVPLSRKLSEGLEMIERARSGNLLSCAYDWATDSVMQQVRNERMKSAVDAHKTGIPWRVLNDYYDLGLPNFTGDKTGFLPIGLETVEAKLEGEDPQADEPQDEPQAAPEDQAAKVANSVSKLESLFAQRKAAAALPPAPPAHKGCACGEEDGVEIRAEDRDERRVKLWRQHMALQAPAVKLMKGKVTKVLAEARKETLANLEASKSLPGCASVAFWTSSFLWVTSLCNWFGRCSAASPRCWT